MEGGDDNEGVSDDTEVERMREAPKANVADVGLDHLVGLGVLCRPRKRRIDLSEESTTEAGVDVGIALPRQLELLLGDLAEKDDHGLSVFPFSRALISAHGRPSGRPAAISSSRSPERRRSSARCSAVRSGGESAKLSQSFSMRSRRSVGLILSMLTAVLLMPPS